MATDHNNLRPIEEQSVQDVALLVVALISVALGFVAFILPRHLSSSTNQPPLGLLVGFGLCAIVGMALALMAVARLGLPMSKATAVAVFTFNVAIILVKFVLSPLGLYRSNALEPFQQGPLGGITNDPSTFAWAAIGSTLLYVLVLWLIYKYFASRGAAPSKRSSKIFWLILLFVVLTIVTGGGLLIVVAFPLIDYLSKLGPTLTVIAVVLAAAIMLAILAFASAAAEAKKLRRPTLIASVFWLCLCLILMYHILWVVFMTALVTIWPFKTFIPNVK